jgi:hypothetical protein
VPELSAHELVAEWRKALDSMAGVVASVGDQVEIPRQLVEPMRRQLELVQELVARERTLQQQAAKQLLTPIDAVFDVLEASGVTLHRQAEALESAGRALEESARLVKAQAELFERAVGALREPSDRAKAVIGLKPQASKQARRQPRRGRAS